MADQCPTIGSLIALGFEIGKTSAGLDGAGYKFVHLDLDAVHVINPNARPVVLLSGVLNTGRTLALIEDQIPDDLGNPLEAAAWVTYALRSHRSDLEPLPSWFEEGERHWELVPMARQQREAEERNRAYSASPSCYIDRDYARPLRRQLTEQFTWLSGETEMTIGYDGRVLSIVLEERTHEVVASGDRWPSSFRVIVSPESQLPARFDSRMVEVNVFEGFVSLDGVSLGPCEPA
ncbi:MAG: hypothetical protein OXE17_00050 [Chloroflexi bacterium]|nr:hypothetical protein [Chloroflexota bacterium]